MADQEADPRVGCEIGYILYLLHLSDCREYVDFAAEGAKMSMFGLVLSADDAAHQDQCFVEYLVWNLRFEKATRVAVMWVDRRHVEHPPKE